jgi:hypothetical protein
MRSGIPNPSSARPHQGRRLTRRSRAMSRPSSPKWRQFEELVARIEKHLAPKGAKVASSDHVPDFVAGGTRQVDATIRYRVGSSDLLIAIECRDRSAKPDVRWIEEIASKKADCRIDRMIAVSSKGFTKKAQKKATAHGISARVIKEIALSEIQEWMGSLSLKQALTNFLHRRITFHFYDRQNVPLEVLAPTVESINRDILNAAVFHEVETDKWLSMRDLLADIVHRKGATKRPASLAGGDSFRVGPLETAVLYAHPGDAIFLEGIPHDGTPIHKRIAIDFEPKSVTIRTTEGEIFIKQFIHIFTAVCGVVDTPAPFAVQYESKNEETSFQYAERSVPFAGGILTISQHREVPASKK